MRLLREAYGRFATGVAVVVVERGGLRYGMTVNSLSSVSLDPPLMLWCLAENTSPRASYLFFAEAERFYISILREGQEAIAREAALPDQHLLSDDFFVDGSPYIRDALASFACLTKQRVMAGDHMIIIGSVEFFTMAEGEVSPLIFFQSDYRQLK